MEVLESLAEAARRFGSPEKLASIIDHTLLSPSAGLEDALRVIDEASKHGFYCAMLHPYHIIRVHREAGGAGVRLCSVVGFPGGFHPPDAKLAELAWVAEYVEEVDVVANISAAVAGDLALVEQELAAIVEDARERGVKIVKVIVEAPLVDDNTLGLLVAAAAKAGADYVKTSTGVYSKGGDVYTVLRLASHAKRHGLKVKAAGGIRTGIDALLAVASGAHRIGTSRGPQVIESFARLIGAGET